MRGAVGTCWMDSRRAADTKAISACCCRRSALGVGGRFSRLDLTLSWLGVKPGDGSRPAPTSYSLPHPPSRYCATGVSANARGLNAHAVAAYRRCRQDCVGRLLCPPSIIVRIRPRDISRSGRTLRGIRERGPLECEAGQDHCGGGGGGGEQARAWESNARRAVGVHSRVAEANQASAIRG